VHMRARYLVHAHHHRSVFTNTATNRINDLALLLAWTLIGNTINRNWKGGTVCEMFFTKQLFLLLPLLAATATAKSIDHGAELTNWLKKNKGYFHPGLEIRRQVFGDADPDAETPYYGMVATKNIPKGEVLLEIPKKLLVGPHELPVQVGDRITVWFEEHNEWFGGEIVGLGGRGTMTVQFDDGDVETVYEDAKWEREEDFDCTTVRVLAEEVDKGEESDFKPYIRYLQSQPRGQLPATWSEAGKDLLRELLGPLRKDESVNEFVSDEPHTILPPELGTRNSYAQDFHDRCASRLPFELSDEEFDDYLNWYSLLNQRGWDELMIPVFDMMSHGNGKLLNTDHGDVRDGSDVVQVFASRDIAKGEEICTTYNFCANCENRFMGYGTPELLRDYGFVEGSPQRWFFHEQRIAFELDMEADKYVVTWLRKTPPKESFVFLKEQLVRLRELSKTVLSDLAAINEVYESPLPQQEWDTILKYQEALVVAMTEALKSAGMDPAKLCEDSDSDSDETCHTRLAYYDELEFVDPKDEEWVIDRPATCNEGPEGEWHPFHTNPSRGLQAIHSPYQDIEFYANVLRNDDTCFQLDSGQCLHFYHHDNYL
jgi:SET domain